MRNTENIIRDFVLRHNLKIGDVIVTNLFQTGQSAHFIMFLGFNNFIQNTKERNVAMISINDLVFEIENYFKRIDRFIGTDFERQIVSERALTIKKAGRQYNWITYNCEHFIKEARTGKAHSQQVDNAAAIVGASGIGLAIYGVGRKINLELFY